MPAKTPLHRIFCENTRVRRLQLGLSQDDAAKIINKKQSHWARIEAGGTRIVIDGIEEVAQALQTTASKLLMPHAFDRKKKSSDK